MGIFISIIVTFLLAALVIYIVGRLGLGLTVSGFGIAFLAALYIAIISGLFSWFAALLGISFGGGLVGAIIHVIVGAIILIFSGSLLPGLKVDGFGGAIFAVISIGIVSWIVNWLVGLLGFL